MALPDFMEFKIAIPRNAGFLGRKCGGAECGRYFKVHEDSLQDEMHCPYCGEQFPNDKMWTSAQTEYAKKKVLQQVAPVVEKELRDMMRKALSGGAWKFTPGRPSPPRPDPAPPAEPGVDSELRCPECKTRFQVDGIFGYCPGCKAENLRLYDANLAVIEQEVSRSPNPTRALRHAYSDLVATFETFARREADRYNLGTAHFQNLSSTRRKFRDALGVDLFAALDEGEIRPLRRVFQKRHVHEHNGGVANDRYVKMIPEDAALLGKSVPLSLDELRAAAGALRRVLEALVAHRQGRGA